MRRKKKLGVGIGATNAALDQFESMRKRVKRAPPTHADLRAGMPRLKRGSEKHVRTERDER